jgi:hypothetical protein
LYHVAGRGYLSGMADHCCAPPPLKLDLHRGNNAHRRVLWAALAINGAMFLVEIGAGVGAGSASLQADALDFLGDAANYSISLFSLLNTTSFIGCVAVGMTFITAKRQHHVVFPWRDIIDKRDRLHRRLACLFVRFGWSFA